MKQKITLKEMLDLNYHNNLLDLKRQLIRSKNHGIIFYKVNMCNLEADLPFEFYYAFSKKTNNDGIAFPIPIDMYREYLLYKDPSLLNLTDYYETNSIPNDEFLKSFSIFKGKKYVWFYH